MHRTFLALLLGGVLSLAMAAPVYTVQGDIRSVETQTIGEEEYFFVVFKEGGGTLHYAYFILDGTPKQDYWMGLMRTNMEVTGGFMQIEYDSEVSYTYSSGWWNSTGVTFKKLLGIRGASAI
jgi:hypothetical protein